MVTCRYCRSKINKETAKKLGKNSYYCPDCLDKKEQEEEEKNLESQQYRDLIEYICKLYNVKAPSGMILKQIKEMREEYNYKLSGMKLALQYFYEIENHAVMDDTGVGIIPYVYEKAKKHYLMKKSVEKSIENYEEQECNSVQVKSLKHAKPKSNIEYIDIVSL